MKSIREQWQLINGLTAVHNEGEIVWCSVSNTKFMVLLYFLFSFGFAGTADADWILVKVFGIYVGLQAIDRDLFHLITDN